INVGLAPIQCDTEPIAEGDRLEVDLAAGQVRDLTRDLTIDFAPLPPVMRAILDAGGLVPYVQAHGDLEI
ncbi:MAG: 3-isopropylmalate dehydratase, partial [Planctomycetota bacterium]